MKLLISQLGTLVNLERMERIICTECGRVDKPHMLRVEFAESEKFCNIAWFEREEDAKKCVRQIAHRLSVGDNLIFVA